MSNFISRVEDGYHLFWGDLHGHTVYSDGIGSLEDYYTFGRDKAGLDFCAVSDHAFFNKEVWDMMKNATLYFNKNGEFVVFLGIETRTKEADFCIYFKNEDVEYENIWGIETDEVYKFASSYSGLVIPHLHKGMNWNRQSPEVQRCVEIYSCWGNHESGRCACKSISPLFTHDHSVQAALDKGHRLGITAGSDDQHGRHYLL